MLYALISRSVSNPREIPDTSRIYVSVIANTVELENRLSESGRSVTAQTLSNLLDLAGTGQSVTIVPEPIAAEILALGDQRDDLVAYELGNDLSLTRAANPPLYAKVVDRGEAIVGQSLFGGAGIDFLGGSDAGELIVGNASGDFILTRGGNNRVFAGSDDNGDDLIIAGNGNDILGGGPGNDIIMGFKGRDLIFGGPGADSLFGTDTFAGPDDNDRAPDTIWAGSGNDFIQGADGRDILGGGAGSDTIYAIGGADTVYGGADGGADVIFGDKGNDVIYGGRGNDGLFGGANDDLIFNGAGDDVVDGGAGNDTMWGGEGNDVFFGGDVSSTDNDTYAFVPGNGIDIIDAFDVAHDTIRFAEGPSRIGQVRFVDAGLDLELRAEGMIIVLRDVDQNELTSDNFLFG